MHFIICLVLSLMSAFLCAAELFPFQKKGSAGYASYIVYGKVNIVPKAEQSQRGLVEILEGGFTRNIGWTVKRTGWIEISVRFRNVANADGKPGLQVTLNDKNGFAAQVYGRLTQEGDDLRCTARVPVAPDVSRLSLWCRGVKGTATGVDQYVIREIPCPEIHQIPKIPKIQHLKTDEKPFTVEFNILHYTDNSRGATVERAEGSGAFKVAGEIPSGFHSFKDTSVKAGKTYRYRVKNRSHGGESKWSAVVTAVIPLWKCSPGKTVYYVDSVKGNDKNSGESPETAWKSLKRVNHTVFASGDQIKLKRGSVWNDPMELRGSGSADAPIKLSAYGKGPLPAIAVKDTYYAVRLKNQDNWDISEIDLSSRQTIPKNIQEVKIVHGRTLRRDSLFFAPHARRRRQIAMLVELENFGVAENIHIHDLNIHDVEGPQNAKESGGIVVRINGNQKASRFNNLTIRNNRLMNVCRSGIVFVVWPHARRTHWFPSTNVEISGNRLKYIGGDGIVPWACDGVKVTGNILLYGAWTALDANAGIWPWSCDNAVISGNVSGFTCKYQGNGDGQGYDVDTNNYNTTLENNVSFMNDGGFLLICGESHTLNRKITVRNNLSICDRMAGVTLWNNLKDVDIYNNTFITTSDCRAVFLLVNWGKGDSDPIQMKNVRFHNNLVLADTPLTFRGMQKSWKIYDNVYTGTYAKGLIGYGTDNQICDPKFKCKTNGWGDIMSELDNFLIEEKINAGADVQRIIDILKSNGCLPKK